MKTSSLEKQDTQDMQDSRQQGLHELFVDQIKDLYDAENQLVKALPKMAKAATSPELKAAIEDHLEETKGHVERLERVFAEIGIKPSAKKCAAMKGLIEEGQETLKKKEESVIKDADIIAAAQRVEHYEMAGYGTVRTYAQILGMDEAAQLLQDTLNEEGQADKTLTAISEGLLGT